MSKDKGSKGLDGTGRGGPKDSTPESSVEGTVHAGGEKGGDRVDTGPNPGHVKGSKK